MESFESALKQISENRITHFQVSDFDDMINADKLAAAFKQNTSLRSVKLDSAKLSLQDSAKIIRSLAAHMNLESLDVSSLPLGNSGAEAIAELLQNTPSIRQIIANDASIRNEGGLAIAKGMLNHPQLHKLSASRNLIDKSGLKAIVDSVAESQRFTELNITYNRGSAEVCEEGEAVLNASTNQNLLVVSIDGGVSSLDLTTTNNARANYFASQLSPFANPETQTPLDGVELRELDRRDEAVRTKLSSAGDVLDATFAALPVLTSAETLFSADERGYAPLDNPRLWKSPEHAIATLESLTLTTELLEKRTEKGSGVLNAAVHSIPPVDLMEYLNGKGVKLGAKELLQEDGSPNDLLEQFTAKPDGVKALFRDDNWVGKKASEASAVYEALPDARKEVPIHSLRQRMAAEARSSGIGR